MCYYLFWGLLSLDVALLAGVIYSALIVSAQADAFVLSHEDDHDRA
jgi:hypothetical protein